MDKQILPDGADSESSTGYHRLKLELLLYSFVLCRENGIEIEQKYWQKLRAMADYTRAYLRPDGRAPLIGDSDSGQILPIVKRAGDDHAYVLALWRRRLFRTHASGVPACRRRAYPKKCFGFSASRACATLNLCLPHRLRISGVSGCRHLHSARRRSLSALQCERLWLERSRLAWSQRCAEHRSISMRNCVHRRSRLVRLHARLARATFVSLNRLPFDGSNRWR